MLFGEMIQPKKWDRLEACNQLPGLPVCCIGLRSVPSGPSCATIVHTVLLLDSIREDSITQNSFLAKKKIIKKYGAELFADES